VGVTGPEDSREERSRELLKQIWLRNRSTTLERLSVVEAAVAALAAGELAPDRRDAALGEAHKLRGILGTYGFDEGSVLAGEAEDALQAGAPAPNLSERLGAYARSLPDS
jgi:HPt (histidine-containing phosphotransfer) domain-containing protein